MMIEITTYVQSPGSFRAIYTPRLGPLFVTARTPPTALGRRDISRSGDFPINLEEQEKGESGPKAEVHGREIKPSTEEESKTESQ